MTLKIKKVYKQPFFEYGFWWWWNEEKQDWFTSCAPLVGIPNWAIIK